MKQSLAKQLMSRGIALLHMTASVFLLACASTTSPPPTVISPSDPQPNDQNRQHSTRLVNRLEGIGAFDEDPDSVAAVAPILFRLSAPSEPPLTLRIIRNPSPNAMVLGDGTVFVHSGLISRLTHPDQLAFVLAHEVSHWRRNHASRKGTTTGEIKTTSALVDTLATPFLTSILPQSVAESAIDALTDAATSGYSRELEREADSDALELLWNRGFDTARAADVHMIYAGISKRYPRTERSLFFRTHPSTEERYQSITTWLGAHSIASPTRIATDPEFLGATARLRLANASWNRRSGRYFEALEDLAVLKDSRLDSQDIALERARTYAKMVEEFSRAKRSVTPSYWSKQYGTLSDDAVRTLWFDRSRAIYDRILRTDPCNASALRDRGLLLSLYEEREGDQDLLQYLIERPQAPDRRFIKRVLTERYGRAQ